MDITIIGCFLTCMLLFFPRLSPPNVLSFMLICFGCAMGKEEVKLMSSVSCFFFFFSGEATVCLGFSSVVEIVGNWMGWNSLLEHEF